MVRNGGTLVTPPPTKPLQLLLQEMGGAWDVRTQQQLKGTSAGIASAPEASPLLLDAASLVPLWPVPGVLGCVWGSQ